VVDIVFNATTKMNGNNSTLRLTFGKHFYQVTHTKLHRYGVALWMSRSSAIFFYYFLIFISAIVKFCQCKQIN